jgi:hypothetical protein
VNGGIRHEVRQVHFHLHQPKDKVLALHDVAEQPLLLETKKFKIYELLDAVLLHLVLVPTYQLLPLSKWRETDVEQLAKLELPLAELEHLYNLNSRGFSLILQEASELEREKLVLYLTAVALK